MGRSSDNSSDDDTPLLQLKKRAANITAALYMYSQENCQLCDEICYNKYEYLVHNAKHIIIPLMRDSLLHCLSCKKYFATEENLELHNNKHHNVPDILESIIKSTPVVKCDSSVNELIRINNEQKLSDIISREVVVRCDDNLKELLKVSNELKINNEIIGNKELMECDSTVNEIDVDSKILESKATSTVIYEIEDDDDEDDSVVSSNIKGRLVFEDDEVIEDDIIQLQSRTTLGVCNEFICDLTEDSNDEINSEQIDPNNGPMILGSKEENSPAVHYDDLMVPGEHKCMRCSKMFENRFKLIQHEKTHLKFRLRHPLLCTYCDKYIAGNHYSLRDHRERKHNISDARKMSTHKCKRCSLQYHSIFKHTINYHRIYVCSLCEQRFEDESERNAHVPTCKGVDDRSKHMVEPKNEFIRVIKICELCALFCKNNPNARYIHLGDYSKDGERVTCERCEKKFFEVKLVKMITKLKERYERKKPVLTNANRLKNIQQRLKMISKLNKF